MNLKLCILSRYDRMGASSRVRLFQYLPYLRSAGFDVTIESFFDSAYLQAIYADDREGLGAVRHYLRRLGRRRALRGADVIWLEKEAFPWFPWFLERAFLPRGVPFVSDYDDAVFHRYDQHRSPLVRRLLGRKIDAVMRHSAIVFAGNDYLRTRAIEAGATHVELIPTVVDLDQYTIGARQDDGWPVRIGWVGTPETWSGLVAGFVPMLKDIVASHQAEFRALGAGEALEASEGFVALPWSEESEVEQIQTMDIGIMPLPDYPWAKGKCGYKLIQYMACGLPVVASPVGVNAVIVEHGVNGYLASTPDEWRDALKALVEDPDLRRRMGEAGRAKVEQHYSLQIYGPEVAALLRGAVRGVKLG